MCLLYLKYLLHNLLLRLLRLHHRRGLRLNPCRYRGRGPVPELVAMLFHLSWGHVVVAPAGCMFQFLLSIKSR